MDSGEVTRKLSQAAKQHRDQCLDIMPAAHHVTWAFIADAGANRHRVMRWKGSSGSSPLNYRNGRSSLNRRPEAKMSGSILKAELSRQPSKLCEVLAVRTLLIRLILLEARPLAVYSKLLVSAVQNRVPVNPAGKGVAISGQ